MNTPAETSPARYIAARELAELARIAPRRSRRALARALSGKPWRGTVLRVREAYGRGGKKGISYEVAVASLPRALQARWREMNGLAPEGVAGEDWPADRLGETMALPPPPDPEAWRRERRGARRLYEPVQEILEAPERSPERAALLRALAEREGKSESWARALVRRTERRGILACVRRPRADAGRRRVVTWRALDRALRGAGVAEPAIAELHERIARAVASFFASGAPSEDVTGHFARAEIVPLVKAVAPAIDDEALLPLCKPPRSFLRRLRHYRTVHIKRTDAADFSARIEPRTQRHRLALRPGQWLAVDIFHADIYVMREDGTLATPKGVIWVDLATNRVFLSMFLPPKGEMIRTEHVVASFIDLISDPRWGVPDTIYADNGKELGWLDEFAGYLSQLKREVACGNFDELDRDWRAVVRGRPHNPQGKVAEPIIAAVNWNVMGLFVEHQGGNRLRTKSANKGKPPSHYRGSFETFKAEVAKRLAFYNARPQQNGHIAGLSPNQALQRFVDAGHKSTIMRREHAELHFSREVRRAVLAGGEITIEGTSYVTVETEAASEQHLGLFVGRRVAVRVPLTSARDLIYVFRDTGEFLCLAGPKKIWAFADRGGARDQTRRGRGLRQAVKSLEDQTERRDLGEAAERATALLPPAADVEPETILSIDPSLLTAATAIERAPDAPRPSRLRRHDQEAVDDLDKMLTGMRMRAPRAR